MRLFGKWYVVKDTGRPVDYPPRASAELVENRLRIVSLEEQIQRMRQNLRGI